jgi:hypothetical protein
MCTNGYSPVHRTALQIHKFSLLRQHTRNDASPFARTSGNTLAQRTRMTEWLQCAVADRARVLVLEVGAGTAVPTIRELFSDIALDVAAQVKLSLPRQVRTNSLW